MPPAIANNQVPPATISGLPASSTLSPKDVTSPNFFKPSTSTLPDNRSSYFPQYGPRSPRSRSPAPSESLSASVCLNSGNSFLRSQSSGNSLNSSDLSSITSSSYLTPPEFPPDNEAPPHKASRWDSNRLIMAKRKSKTAPPDGWRQKGTRGQYNKSGFRHAQKNSLQHQDQAWWGKSSMTLSCEATGKYTCPGRRKAQSKTKDEISKSLYSTVAAPVETRRWSSIEIGAKSLRSSRSTTVPDSSRTSSIYHENSPNEDVIEAICAKLKTRKVPSICIESPATIRLRKASGASSIASPTNTPSFWPEHPSKELNSKGWQSANERRPSAYLITSSEIDSIVRLIKENLKKSQQSHMPGKFHFQPQTPVHRPSVCNGFISVHNVAPADVAMTLSDVQGYCATKGDNSTPTPRRVSSGLSVSKIYSARSVHEIVWDGVSSRPKRPTLKSVMSTSAAEGFSYERTYSTYDEFTPGNLSPGASWTTKITAGGTKRGYLSPFASPIIETSFEWSESKPQGIDNENFQAALHFPDAEMMNQIAAIPVIITDGDSRSEKSGSQTNSKAPFNEESKSKAASRAVLHKKAERVNNPFISAVTQQLDVISFPALPPRQKTSDWISPLPDMSAPIRVSGKSRTMAGKRTMYKLGLDITQSSAIDTKGDPKLCPDLATPTSPISLLSGSDQGTNADSCLEHHYYNGSSDRDARRKTLVLQQSTVDFSRDGLSSRTGMGKSIGASAGRRKSSGYTLRNVSDIAKSGGERGSREEPGSIMKALIGSKSETDVRRKSLSQHSSGRRVRIIVDSEVEDRACEGNSWAKKNGNGLWKSKAKEKNDSDGFRLLQPGMGSMNMVNNTIPGGISTFLTPPYSPRSAPILSSSTPSYPFSLSASSASSSPKPTTRKSVLSLKSIKPSSLLHSSKTPPELTRSFDRLRLLEPKCPPSVQEDCVGIYITMTGTRGAGEGLGRNSGGEEEEGVENLCLVGCENHNYDESGGEGVDWIGLGSRDQRGGKKEKNGS